ncbi:nucleotide sugar dehydrogenase [Fervidicoccus fontis]|uniref:UDP-N-acetyl-D-mannosamine dehydrogenase n=1 Tax=Fervidicoccus fontis (strain DSM 19380 / JCM 18336 / VKM B-2539 / Kam940) TaxID=1163730 RepID=I0A1P9_FERFK|nr:nucleotide sugar dehydrogenase [Fervidicoccus fontis]AFH42906.1 udp-n-acetyl-d-mannosaminuronic acid dehydrogenase [Fervidicoccus fontis Kam940]
MVLLGKSRNEASNLLLNGELTVSVFGLGKMGLPLALVFASKGAKVYGVDLNENVVEMVNRGENPISFEPGVGELLEKAVKEKRLTAVTDGALASSKSDLIVLLVPVYANAKGIRMELMEKAIDEVSNGIRKGAIVVTETTLPPGTTESFIPKIENVSGFKAGIDFGIAHAPERTMSGRVIKDITESYPKIIGAINEATLEPLIGIYSAINKKGVVPVSSIRVAEAVKVFEGVYRDVNIALANELALISERLGINVNEAIDSANTQPYSHIHRPGAGVGGHCIGVYTWFLIHSFPELSKIMKIARETNDSMPLHIVELTVKALNLVRKPVNGARIIVFGLSYRGGIKETINSPSFPLINEFLKWGANVEVYDPYFSNEEIMSYGFKPFNGNFEGADAVVVVTDHPQFKEVDLRDLKDKMATPIIIDGRYIYATAKGIENFIYASPGIQIRCPKSFQ